MARQVTAETNYCHAMTLLKQASRAAMSIFPAASLIPSTFTGPQWHSLGYLDPARAWRQHNQRPPTVQVPFYYQWLPAPSVPLCLCSVA